jgi:nitric oxide reductase subunit B
MTIAMLIAGYEQSFIERATGGSTWQAYFAAQLHPWFIQSMQWRLVFGIVTMLGVLLLVWDLVTIGRKETRTAMVLTPPDDQEKHGEGNSSAQAAPAG